MQVISILASPVARQRKTTKAALKVLMTNLHEIILATLCDVLINSRKFYKKV